jgi:hypothetical protein
MIFIHEFVIFMDIYTYIYMYIYMYIYIFTGDLMKSLGDSVDLNRMAEEKDRAKNVYIFMSIYIIFVYDHAYVYSHVYV